MRDRPALTRCAQVPYGARARGGELCRVRHHALAALAASGGNVGAELRFVRRTGLPHGLARRNALRRRSGMSARRIGARGRSLNRRLGAGGKRSVEKEKRAGERDKSRRMSWHGGRLSSRPDNRNVRPKRDWVQSQMVGTAIQGRGGMPSNCARPCGSRTQSGLKQVLMAICGLNREGSSRLPA